MMNLNACASFHLEPTEDVHTFSSNLSIIVVVSVIFVLVAAFTTFANLTVIIALTRSLIKDHNGAGFLRSHNEISKYLMTSMAITDATLGSFIMPLGVYELIYNGKWFLSQELCKTRYTADVFLSTVSIYHVTCMAVDRYLAVCRPLVYRRLPIRTCYFMIGVSWLLPGLLILMPILSGWYNNGLEDVCFLLNNVCRLTFSFAFQIGAVTISFYFPILIIFILYSLIMKEVFMFHNRLPKPGGQTFLPPGRDLKSKQVGKYSSDNNLFGESSGEWDPSNIKGANAVKTFSGFTPNSSTDREQTPQGNSVFKKYPLVFCCLENIRKKFGKSDHSAAVYKRSLNMYDLTTADHDSSVAVIKNNENLFGQTGSYAVFETTFSTGQIQTAPHGYVQYPVITVTGKDVSAMETSNDYEMERLRPEQSASSVSSAQLSAAHKAETVSATIPLSPSLAAGPMRISGMKLSESQESNVSLNPATLNLKGHRTKSYGSGLTPSGSQESNIFLNPTKLSPKAQMTNSHGMPRRKPSRNNLKAVQTVGMIVICLTLCWLPFSIYIVISTHLPNQLPIWSYVMVTWLGYINSALNPILYCGNKSIRQVIISFLCGSASG